MKKTNKYLLLSLIVLSLLAVIVYFVQQPKVQTTYRDFAVQDTASIDKIFLANKSGKEVLLERHENHWTANKTYKARHDFVNILLETIKRIEISSPVQESKHEKVLKDIAAIGIKAEIYSKNKLIKSYYVGGTTNNDMGTYMIIEGSDIPFILHIPGFNGYLTVRYVPEINEWREKQVFNYKFNEIAKVLVEYPDSPDESFIAINKGDNTFNLTNIDESPLKFEFDTLSVKEYISRIKFIGFEAYISDEQQNSKLDSLKNEPVISQFSIIDNEGIKNTLKTYNRQNITRIVDDEGNLYDWDIDRLYGVINDETVVILQYYILDPISYRKYDFIESN